MKFSCAEYTFPLLSRRQALHLIALLDFQAVDIGLFARSRQYPPAELLRDPGASAAVLARELREAGLQAADIFLQIGEGPSEYSANDPRDLVRAHHRDMFERAVEFTAAAGCRHLTGLPGVPHDGMPPRQALERAAAEAAWRVETANRAGVAYAVEAHVGSVCPDPASALALLQAVPGLSLALDYGHFICEGVPNQPVHALLPFASHLHARAARPGKLQARFTENTIDFAAIFERLHASGYQGFVCLEYVWTEWRACNETDNLSETVLLREHLQTLAARSARTGDSA